jgi:hypothetical protein
VSRKTKAFSVVAFGVVDETFPVTDFATIVGVLSAIVFGGDDVFGA